MDWWPAALWDSWQPVLLLLWSPIGDSPCPRAEVEKGCKPVRVGLRAWATIGFGAVDARPAEIILAAYCASGSLFFSEMYPRFFAERNMNLDLLLPPIGKNIR
jgi:hypothetical protein